MPLCLVIWIANVVPANPWSQSKTHLSLHDSLSSNIFLQDLWNPTTGSQVPIADTSGCCPLFLCLKRDLVSLEIEYNTDAFPIMWWPHTDVGKIKPNILKEPCWCYKQLIQPRNPLLFISQDYFVKSHGNQDLCSYENQKYASDFMKSMI